jgi:arginyl-tRNA synthetase
MLMRDKIAEIIKKAAGQEFDVEVSYPDSKFGDYATNAALVLAKKLKQKPQDLAKSLIEKMDKTMFESVEVAGAGFINFRLKTEHLLQPTTYNLQPKSEGKILLEYFQPNIAKPMHMGLLRTAIIGDAIKRMLLFSGYKAESDTHMGDWGTQFGMLIASYKNKKEENPNLAQMILDNVEIAAQAYMDYSHAADEDPPGHFLGRAKSEFVKLEKGDAENRKIWQQFVNTSMKEFLQINDLMDILPFDHHWPESFYEDKMPAVLEELKKKKLLKESQGAQIVDLEEQSLGVAVIMKSDGGTTYLLRDLATFIFAKNEGFAKHLYVVDNRQSHHYKQMFAILKLMGVTENMSHSQHIDYGFISFKGEALSTRKGNMVLAKDVVEQAEAKVAMTIAQKNPDLTNKGPVISAVAKAAIKYFDLKHNRHSDIEFDWNEALDFEGDSGPYLQYAYARLSSILRKSQITNNKLQINSKVQITNTEREILFKSSILSEIVEDSLKDYLPNVLANYLFNFAGLMNKFYHESPVIAEKDEKIRNFRLALIARAKETLGKGLDLLGIQALDEM